MFYLDMLQGNYHVRLLFRGVFIRLNQRKEMQQEQ